MSPFRKRGPRLAAAAVFGVFAGNGRKATALRAANRWPPVRPSVRVSLPAAAAVLCAFLVAYG
jgi:hypothetical protein